MGARGGFRRRRAPTGSGQRGARQAEGLQPRSRRAPLAERQSQYRICPKKQVFFIFLTSTCPDPGCSQKKVYFSRLKSNHKNIKKTDEIWKNKKIGFQPAKSTLWEKCDFIRN